MLIAHGSPGDDFHDRAFARVPRGAPVVAYLGAANGEQPRWFRAIERALGKRYGAKVVHARAGSDDEIAEARPVLAGADVIYVGGGDVALLAERIVGSGLDEIVRARHAAGALLVGVSAGAIGLTSYWVRFPEDDPTLVCPTRFRCIGALPLAVDVHDEAADWEELRALLWAWGHEEPDAVVEGFGIPSRGALEIDADGVPTPLGPPPKRLRLERGKVREV
jgi:hypothetical protein